MVPQPARPLACGSNADRPFFVDSLVLALLELQLCSVIVNSGITHYRTHHCNEMDTLYHLEAVLNRHQAGAADN